MSTKANEFIEWLDEQEKETGFSDYEIARKGGFSHSVLSRARSGIPPKWDICVSIANVLNVSPITIFRKAGLLPQGQNDRVEFSDWEHLLSQLSFEDQEEMRQLAKMKIERRQKNKSLKPLTTKKAP